MEAGILLSEFHTVPIRSHRPQLVYVDDDIAGFHTFPHSFFDVSIQLRASKCQCRNRKLFRLLSKSWDPQVPRERLEEAWLELIEETRSVD